MKNNLRRIMGVCLSFSLTISGFAAFAQENNTQTTNGYGCSLDFASETELSNLEFDNSETYTYLIEENESAEDNSVLKLGTRNTGNYDKMSYSLSDTGITDDVVKVSYRINRADVKTTVVLYINDTIGYVWTMNKYHPTINNGFYVSETAGRVDIGGVEGYYPYVNKFEQLDFEFDMKNNKLRIFEEGREAVCCENGEAIDITKFSDIKKVSICIRAGGSEETDGIVYLDSFLVMSAIDEINDSIAALPDNVTAEIQNNPQIVIDLKNRVQYYQNAGYTFSNTEKLDKLYDELNDYTVYTDFYDPDDLSRFQIGSTEGLTTDVSNGVMEFSRIGDDGIYYGLKYTPTNAIKNEVVRVSFRAMREPGTSLVLNINDKTSVYMLNTSHMLQRGFYVKDKDNGSVDIGNKVNYYPLLHNYQELTFEYDLKNGRLRVYEDKKEAYVCLGGKYIDNIGITEINNIMIGMRAKDASSNGKLWLDSFSVRAANTSLQTREGNLTYFGQEQRLQFNNSKNVDFNKLFVNNNQIEEDKYFIDNNSGILNIDGDVFAADVANRVVLAADDGQFVETVYLLPIDNRLIYSDENKDGTKAADNTIGIGNGDGIHTPWEEGNVYWIDPYGANNTTYKDEFFRFKRSQGNYGYECEGNDARSTYLNGIESNYYEMINKYYWQWNISAKGIYNIDFFKVAFSNMAILKVEVKDKSGIRVYHINPITQKGFETLSSAEVPSIFEFAGDGSEYLKVTISDRQIEADGNNPRQIAIGVDCIRLRETYGDKYDNEKNYIKELIAEKLENYDVNKKPQEQKALYYEISDLIVNAKATGIDVEKINGIDKYKSSEFVQIKGNATIDTSRVETYRIRSYVRNENVLQEAPYMAIAALYKNEVFDSLQIIKGTLSPGENLIFDRNDVTDTSKTIRLNMPKDDLGSIYTIKQFIINDFDSIKPYCDGAIISK